MFNFKMKQKYFFYLFYFYVQHYGSIGYIFQQIDLQILDYGLKLANIHQINVLSMTAAINGSINCTAISLIVGIKALNLTGYKIVNATDLHDCFGWRLMN